MISDPPPKKEEPHQDVDTNDTDQKPLVAKTFSDKHNFIEPDQISLSRHTAPVPSYTRSIRKVRVLGREQEVTLAKQIEAGTVLQLEALAKFPGVIDYILKAYEKVSDSNRVEDLLLGFSNPYVAPHPNERIEARLQNEHPTYEGQRELDLTEVERRFAKLKKVHEKCQMVLYKEQDWLTPASKNALANVSNVFKCFKLTHEYHDRILLMAVKSWQILHDKRQQLEQLIGKSNLPIEAFHREFSAAERSDFWLDSYLPYQQDSKSRKEVREEIQLAIRYIDEELLDQRHSRYEIQSTQSDGDAATLEQEHYPRTRYEFVHSIYQGIQRGTEQRSRAWNALIIANQRLVIWIARKYSHPSFDFLDLVGEGNLGLMKAIRKFDYRLGYKLSTYATWWIRQSISRALGDYSRLIRLPFYMHEEVVKLNKTTQEMVHQLGNEPTPEELAERIGVNEAKVRNMQEWDRDVLSIDDPVEDALGIEALEMEFGLDQTLILDSPDEEADATLSISELKSATIADVVEDSVNESPFEHAAKSDLVHAVHSILDEMDSRESQILSMRFGIRRDREYTLQEIGELLGVTRERVRQIESVAKQRLRASIQLEELSR